MTKSSNPLFQPNQLETLTPENQAFSAAHEPSFTGPGMLAAG